MRASLKGTPIIAEINNISSISPNMSRRSSDAHNETSLFAPSPAGGMPAKSGLRGLNGSTVKNSASEPPTRMSVAATSDAAGKTQNPVCICRV